jgi:hypothetical protein
MKAAGAAAPDASSPARCPAARRPRNFAKMTACTIRNILMRSEVARWGAVIRENNIKAQ